MNSSESVGSTWTKTSIPVTLGATLFLSLVVPLLLEARNLSLWTDSSFWVLTAVPVALIGSMAIREMCSRLQFRATSKLALILLYAIATLAPSWLSASIFLNSIGAGHRYLVVYVSVLAYASSLSALAWIGINTFGAARAATLVSNRLEHSLVAAQNLNALLEAAEHRRLLDYQSTISIKVSEPLNRVLTVNEDYSSEVLAQQLELFQTREMRPLSHQMHPVTVKVGLAPAIRSLGPVFHVLMPEDLVNLDVQGLLVHDHVRQQVFRWIQGLTPIGNSVDIRINRDATQMSVTAIGVKCVSELNPTAQVVGLTIKCDASESTMVLRAPLLGQDGAQTPADSDRGELATRTNWKGISAYITFPPYMQLSLIATAAIVVVPFNFIVLKETPESIQSAFIVLTLLGVVMPLLIALPLHYFAKRRFRAPSPWKVVFLWVSLGVLSAFASNLAVFLLAPEKFLLLANAARLLGSMLKFTLTGLLFAATRGYLDQQDRDMRLLESALVDSRNKKAQLLESADETDRFLSETLHRTIQGRLSTITLLFRLDRREEALQELQIMCRDTVPEIEQRLIEALLPQGSSKLPVPSASTDLSIEDTSTWSDLFATNEQIATQLKRVVHECEVNAQRHGEATHMLIVVGEMNGLWEVRCVDDGIGPSRLAKPGLGSNLFDELCAHYSGEWSLVRLNQRTVFTLRIRSAP
jgi:signal transduction histidine kinase